MRDGLKYGFVINPPEVDPIPEALMAAAAAAAEAAGKLARAAGTSGVRKTPEKEEELLSFRFEADT